MWRGNGESGKPEWLANFTTRTSDQLTGIDFTTSAECRGFVTGSGRWGLENQILVCRLSL